MIRCSVTSGRCSYVVEARRLRFWEARNVKRGGELMWMDLLMVDVNATMMQATISSSQPPQFQERFAAGTMFFMSGFDVSRCAHNVRLTDSSLLIRFNETTSFDEITEPVSPLPEKHFDVIGEILGVKSTVCDPPEEKNRDMVTMKLDRPWYITPWYVLLQPLVREREDDIGDDMRKRI
ncbi:hypothetical protein Bca52824_068258 [Brassica carinata]|uniref:Replication protein A 70 kDa DNA-binding subunit B/D first OB fold domain-containing protein n=1 Tax=Brassica carinata TaxID=52824 RepID=A0A8X7U131_BRACI|nr:hypothetical protein Bca52824_068258 [Brassica carinata]